jgi:ParB-like chromosome segregation protein Spo0J
MLIEKKKISELKPAPYNPRKSTEKQEQHLKASLEKFGVVEPIIFNKQTGFIVGGHFRVRELKKLGYKEVDCVIVDLSEEDEKELNVRLNANTGEWEWEQLKEWDGEDLEAWGLDVPIFMIDDSINDIDEVDEFTESVNFVIKCESIEQLEQLQTKLNTSSKKLAYDDFLIKVGL